MPAPAQSFGSAARTQVFASQLPDAGFARRAGWATRSAIGTLALSAVALSLYFGGGGEIFGPVNDVLVAATFVLLAPAVIAVTQLGRPATGRWLGVVSGGALIGIAIATAGQLLLITGVLPLAASFATLGVGALLVMVWTGALAVLALRHGVLARSVGWWSLALVAATVVTAVGTPIAGLDTATLSVVFGIPLLVAIVGLLASLGRDLLRRG